MAAASSSTLSLVFKRHFLLAFFLSLFPLAVSKEGNGFVSNRAFLFIKVVVVFGVSLVPPATLCFAHYSLYGIIINQEVILECSYVVINVEEEEGIKRALLSGS